MNQKGKVFSLIALSGAMLFSFAIIGKNFDFLGTRALDENTIVNDAIDFDGAKVERISDKSQYISRTTTKQGDYVYLACKSDISLSSGSVASFRSLLNEDSDKVDSIIKFYSHNGSSYQEYAFQDINSISIVSSNSITSIGVYKSGDGVNYEKIGSMSVNTYDSANYVYTGSFAISSFEDEYLKLVQESRSSFKPQLKQVVLGYSCDNSYVPPIKHEISSTPTENGSITLSTTKRKAGATASFTVQPADGYVVSSVSTVPEVALNVSGSNYSFVMPESDISINATFEPAPEEIYNVSAVSSAGGTVNFDQPQYHPAELVTFSVTTNNGYEIDSVTTSPEVELSGSDGSYSFVMPSLDVEVSVSYKTIVGLTLSGSYKTSYYVNESLDTTGLVVTAYYNDSPSKVVTDYSASADLSTTGAKNVTISYHGVTETYQITVVTRPTLNSIDVTAPDSARSFYLNDEFSHEGIVVTANYSNGDRVDVSNEAEFTTPDMTTTGSFKMVNVFYEGKTGSYYARVYKKIVSISLEMNEQPVFKKGANFDHNTVTVKANYNNSTTATVNTASFSLDGTRLDTIGDNIEVVVTYTEELAAGKPITITSTYYIKVEESQDPDPGFSGSFTYTSMEIALTLTFDGNGNGTYVFGVYTIIYTYQKTDNNIVLTYVSGDESQFGQRQMFFGNSTATVTLNRDGNIVAKLGSSQAWTNDRTFIKQ